MLTSSELHSNSLKRPLEADAHDQPATKWMAQTIPSAIPQSYLSPVSDHTPLIPVSITNNPETALRLFDELSRSQVIQDYIARRHTIPLVTPTTMNAQRVAQPQLVQPYMAGGPQLLAPPVIPVSSPAPIKLPLAEPVAKQVHIYIPPCFEGPNDSIYRVIFGFQCVNFSKSMDDYYKFNYSKCARNHNFFESWKFMSYPPHAISILVVPLQIYATFLIWTKSPQRMKSVMIPLKIMHFWTTVVDILVSIMLTPYLFLPCACGIPLGIFRLLGIPTIIQVFIGQISITTLVTSIVVLFENRHRAIVDIKYGMSRKSTRIAFHAFNYTWGVLVFFPYFIVGKDEEKGKLAFLKMSMNTQKIQKRVFLSITVSASIVVVTLFGPIFILSLTVTFFSFYNQVYNNMLVNLFTTHGLYSTVTLIIVNEPYRNYTKKLFSKYRLENPSGRSRSNVIYSMSNYHT
ncbi:unnamed protein product [Caenorhabditis bovis]|uniref:Uncharacterized protein n=1 Tax=Caenorhabditis bovis TaxID=2654633 RepID=A0A8S1EWP2_9PELO|nr:unnamed protein product [Caenorhabditis bovis]